MSRTPPPKPVIGADSTSKQGECVEETGDDQIYNVVVNHEEQYSIWPADRENALGWNSVGKSGSKTECLAYINEVWTDMRPLSLRKAMADDEARESER